MFFSSGFAYAVWGVALPTIEKKFVLGDARLGFVLFVLAAGAIVMMLPAGKLIAKIGSRPVCALGAFLHALAIVSISLCQSVEVLLITVACYGAATACFDTAMNAYALEYEKCSNKSLLSAMHGMFSVGGMVGAFLGGSFLANFEGSTLFLLSGLNSLLASIFCVFMVSTKQVKHESHQRLDTKTKPFQYTLKIGFLAFLALLAEGAMYDWSSMFLRDELLVTGGSVSAGYFGFSSGMMLGRLLGDRWRNILKDKSHIIVSVSAAIAFAGVCMLVLTASFQLAVLCFVIIGIGLSNLIPVIFAIAGNVAQNSGQGIAKVSLFAYFGFLLGPLIIGEIASQYSLNDAFLVVGFCLAIIILLNLRNPD